MKSVILEGKNLFINIKKNIDVLICSQRSAFLTITANKGLPQPDQTSLNWMVFFLPVRDPPPRFSLKLH